MTPSLVNRTVLLIDDNTKMLRAVTKVLSDEGATVYCAEWVGDALDLLTNRQTPIDLVITDLRMPHVTGMTVIYAVHQIFPSVPVIVLTAFGSTEMRDACYREGAAAFLEKPLDTAQLLAAVELVMSIKTPGECSVQ
jgi:DNA-binding NtrC family response regulator